MIHNISSRATFESRSYEREIFVSTLAHSTIASLPSFNKLRDVKEKQYLMHFQNNSQGHCVFFKKINKEKIALLDYLNQTTLISDPANRSVSLERKGAESQGKDE